MILISYGITKSGSTLAYQLAKAMLEAAGRPQDILPQDALDRAGRGVNFLARIDADRLKTLIAASEGTVVAVKTHAPYPIKLLPQIDEWVGNGQLKVHANFRDPREICLSMLDAGTKARAAGDPAFADITSLDVAAEKIAPQIDVFLHWASVKDALRLHYNETAFQMVRQVERMAAHLGVPVDAPAVCEFVTKHAKTHRNKAVQDRYKTDLTAQQNAALFARFEAFIKNASETSDPRWFEQQRERYLRLARPAAHLNG